MKIKILVCAYSCASESGVKVIGGEAGLGWNIVCQLARFFDVYVLTHGYNKKSIEEMVKKTNLENANFFYIELPRFLSFLENWHKGGIQIYSYLWQIKAYFIAVKLHEKFKFNVFHHVTYANDWMASYIGALLPIPYIRGPGGGAHRIPVKFTQEFSFKENLSDKLRSIGQWIFRHDPFFIIGQNKAKTILVCNKESFNALPKKWQEKAYFFPVNGITKEDLDLFPQKNKVKGNFLVMTAGKLMKIKGFDLAIKSFKLFSDKFGTAKFSIIGDGPEIKSLKRLSDELKIEDKVLFEHWMEREKLLRKMSDCDVFIFPSLRDGGGAVVVEAMAMGKPVICLDIGGSGFHINEKCGIKIKPESPNQSIQEMADALFLLHKNVYLRQILGQAAQQKAKDFYLWDRLGEQLIKIYEKFI
jgi:glycosyltransferase involved in cell wall biosynthesis